VGGVEEHRTHGAFSFLRFGQFSPTCSASDGSPGR
jgi:hypothetical protein